MFQFRKPRLATHYYVRTEPPDDRGDEVLRFSSETRRITLKGHSFREFQQHVVPLLDGAHSVDDIAERVADVFARQDLVAALDLLAEQRVLEEGDDVPEMQQRTAAIQPQQNLLLDLGVEPRSVQDRLSAMTVTVFGLSGGGAVAAMALAGAGIGRLRLLDDGVVTAADPYLASTYRAADVGEARVDALARQIDGLGMHTRTERATGPFDGDDAVAEAIGRADFLICALDPGLSALIYRLNRVCLRSGTRWIATTSAAFEVRVGPLVHPYETACYLCYRMRAVACSEAPEEEFAFQRFLDHRKRDDSGTRENLVMGTTLAGQLAALEAFKALSGAIPPSTRSNLVVFDLLELASTRHVVLRKPWCPACGPDRVERQAVAT
jgi:bacteriocin biosynthesis cyclodehydratase domain-containing protein